MGKLLHIIIAGVILINSLSSVYFKAGELGSLAIIFENTWPLLMSVEDEPLTASDIEYLFDNDFAPNTYDSKIYDNQYDDSNKIPAIPIPAILSVTVKKQPPGKVFSNQFSSIEHNPSPPNPPPV